jgi:hypothetical protein
MVEGELHRRLKPSLTKRRIHVNACNPDRTAEPAHKMNTSASIRKAYIFQSRELRESSCLQWERRNLEGFVHILPATGIGFLFFKICDIHRLWPERKNQAQRQKSGPSHPGIPTIRREYPFGSPGGTAGFIGSSTQSISNASAC